MSFNQSFSKKIEETLGKGYSEMPLQGGAVEGKVYKGNVKSIVEITSIDLVPPISEQAIEESFKELKRLLEDLNANYPIAALLIPKGGKIQAPSSFNDWCIKNGIEIYVENGEVVNRPVGVDIEFEKQNKAIADKYTKKKGG